MKDAAADNLNKVSDGLLDKKITVMCKVVVNENPADEIDKNEEEANADLVAMSTQGGSGAFGYALGSVADKVKPNDHMQISRIDLIERRFQLYVLL